MTSELKPDYEKFSREICQIAFEGCDADGGSIQDIGVKHGVLREEIFNHKKHSDVVNAECFEDGQTVYCFVAPRAVPDVPELVRYDGSMEGMWKDPNGEYVRYDQAAAIIADKDEMIMRMDRFAQKYKRHMHNSDQRAEAAEAELSQIKAQEPVAWILTDEFNLCVFSDQPLRDEDKADGWTQKPLYAAPVDQTAEIERLREALTRITNLDEAMGHELTVNHAFDVVSIAVNALSEKAPS